MPFSVKLGGYRAGSEEERTVIVVAVRLSQLPQVATTYKALRRPVEQRHALTARYT